MKNYDLKRLGISLVAIVMAMPIFAYADEAQPPKDDDKQDVVIVTATKRDTKLEKTPMAINVLGGAQLASIGVVEPKNLSALVPGFTMAESPGGLSGVSIRGIGTSAGSQVFEQSVGLFVDGVYHPRARQYRDAIFDVERLEVVKGSQGVLFGKNTSVGAVSIVSKAPGKTFGGYLEGQYETNYGSWKTDAAVDIPISDNFRVRISGLYDKMEGYIDNEYLNRKEPAGDRSLARIYAVWTPSDKLTVSLKSQASKMNTVGTAFEYLTDQKVSVLQGYGVADGGLGIYTKYEGNGNLGDTDDYQAGTDHALEIKYELPHGFNLTAITGFTAFKYHYVFDSDTTPAKLIDSKFNEKYQQTSQEIRLTSPVGEKFDYIVGLYYLTSKIRYDYITSYDNFPSGPGLWGIISQKFNQDENTYAIFGQLNYHFTDNLQLSVGGRGTNDKKEGLYNKSLLSDLGHPTGIIANAVKGSSLAQDVTDKTFDYSVNLSYSLSPRSTIYIATGRGNKGSGFVNTTGATSLYPSPFVIPKEVVTTWEAGIKGRFMDGKAYASLSVYDMAIENFQDSFYNPNVRAFQVRSLDAKSRGAEFDGNYRFNSSLTLYGNIAYNPVAELVNGERMQRAPKTTYTLGLRGRQDLTDNLEVSGYLQYLYSSTFLNQPASGPGNNYSGDFGLVDARIEFNYRPAQIAFFISGTNLGGVRYKTYSFSGPIAAGIVGTWNTPTMVNIGFKKTF